MYKGGSQSPGHVNRSWLILYVLIMDIFNFYSKGSLVSLHYTQTSWTLTWLLRSPLCHFSLLCARSVLHPSALWQKCLFRPCWVECPVLKGILFCSCSRVSVSLPDFKGFVWVGDMGVCAWVRAKTDLACVYILWSDQPLPSTLKRHMRLRGRLGFKSDT